MANEIQIQTKFDVRNSPNVWIWRPDNQVITQTGKRINDYLISVGTSEQTLAINGSGTPGFLMFQNQDATNYVQIGISTGVYVWRPKAGQFVNPFPIDPGVTTLYLKANTAAVLTRIAVIEL